MRVQIPSCHLRGRPLYLGKAMLQRIFQCFHICHSSPSMLSKKQQRKGARRAVFRPRLPKVALFGSGRVFIASTPNFGPSLTKLVGTIRFTKKMTHNDNGAGPGRIYGETAVFTFCRKAENGPKIRFFPKKSPKFAKRLIFIWEKGTFFF